MIYFNRSRFLLFELMSKLKFPLPESSRGQYLNIAKYKDYESYLLINIQTTNTRICVFFAKVNIVLSLELVSIS